MVPMTTTSPAFGETDLSNCEREQIHLAGSIQPHGVFLRIDGPSLSIIQASSNAGDILGAVDVIGFTLENIQGDLADKIRRHLDEPLDILPVAVRCHVGEGRRAVDCLLHRPPTGGLIVELEQAGPRLICPTMSKLRCRSLLPLPRFAVSPTTSRSP